MYRNNKGKKRLSVLLAAVLLISLFPVVYAEVPETENLEEDVTQVAETVSSEVTDETELTKEPTSEPTEVPTTEPTEEPTEEPAEEPTEAPAEAPTDEPTPEPTSEPTEEPVQKEVTPNPEPIWDPSVEEDEPEEEEPAPEEEDEYEDKELYEFDDDEVGTVSEELLEQFNNPDTFEHVEFSGTADIELVEQSYSYGDTVTLIAKVQDVNMSYRLVWEATDGDERGWYTIGSGDEYSFVVTPDIMNRGYRVVLFTVD